MEKINIRRFGILKKRKNRFQKHINYSKTAQMSLGGKNPPKCLPIGEPGPSRHMSGKDTNKQNKDSFSACLKKAEKQLVPKNIPNETVADMDDLMDIPDERPQNKKSLKI